MMTLAEAIAEIEARLAEKSFANLTDILGPAWAIGVPFRGNTEVYKSAAIARANRMAAAGTPFGEGA